MATVLITSHVLHQWREAQLIVDHFHPRTQHNASRIWIPPPPSWLKLNIDVAVKPNDNHTGLAWILRDPSQSVIAAECIPIHGVLSVALAEALAIREALSWIHSTNLSNVIIEFDAEDVVQATNSGQIMNSEVGLIIQDCCFLVSQVINIHCSHIRRSANMTAYALATATCLMTERRLWLGSLPSHMCSLLLD